jgi:hypothetical protein
LEQRCKSSSSIWNWPGKNRVDGSTGVYDGNTFGMQWAKCCSFKDDRGRERAGVCTALLLSSRQPVSDWLPKAPIPGDPTHPAAGHAEGEGASKDTLDRNPLSCVSYASTQCMYSTNHHHPPDEGKKNKKPSSPIYLFFFLSYPSFSRPTLRRIAPACIWTNSVGAGGSPALLLSLYLFIQLFSFLSAFVF